MNHVQFKFEKFRVPVSLLYGPGLSWGGENNEQTLKYGIISHPLTALTNHSHLQLLCSVLIFVLGIPDSPVGKEPACNVGDPCSIPGLERVTGEGIGYHSSILGLPL